MRPVYPDFGQREPHRDRPWVSINMVTTIDGKILSGDRHENVMDLGSDVDHQAMREIENASDAVMIGAGSLRATAGLWYPKILKRFVVSASGNIDFESRFFTDAPELAWVVTTKNRASKLPPKIQHIALGETIDWPKTLKHFRTELQIGHLLVEGGSELNASILHEDLVDELFWTIAPKIKLGRDIPTYADGQPLARADILNFDLVSNQTIAHEIYLRYQRRKA